MITPDDFNRWVMKKVSDLPSNGRIIKDIAKDIGIPVSELKSNCKLALGILNSKKRSKTS